MPDTYDSRRDTLEHSRRVGQLMAQMLAEALTRSYEHDLSKTMPPEVELFDRLTPRLRELTYGTDEYNASLAELGPALTHHYQHNRHHPEHFGRDGVNGMTLVDLLEMLADWKASTERMADGDLNKSLEHNQLRFGMSVQLTAILRNTAVHFGWIPNPEEDLLRFPEGRPRWLSSGQPHPCGRCGKDEDAESRHRCAPLVAPDGGK